MKCLGDCGNMLRPIHRTAGEYPGTERVYKDGLCIKDWEKINGDLPIDPVEQERKRVAKEQKLADGVKAGLQVRAAMEAARRNRNVAAGGRATSIAPQLPKRRYGPGLPPPPKATPVYRPSQPPARSES